MKEAAQGRYWGVSEQERWCLHCGDDYFPLDIYKLYAGGGPDPTSVVADVVSPDNVEDILYSSS